MTAVASDEGLDSHFALSATLVLGDGLLTAEPVEEVVAEVS